MEKFTLLTQVFSWLEEKLKTKIGSFLIGILIGLITPISYFYFSEHEIKLLNSRIEDLKNELNAQKELTDEWRTRSLESDKNCLEKMKQMMMFFNQLESNYLKKKEEQEEVFKSLSRETKTLKVISNKINNE